MAEVPRAGKSVWTTNAFSRQLPAPGLLPAPFPAPASPAAALGFPGALLAVGRATHSPASALPHKGWERNVWA